MVPRKGLEPTSSKPSQIKDLPQPRSDRLYHWNVLASIHFYRIGERVTHANDVRERGLHREKNKHAITTVQRPSTMQSCQINPPTGIRKRAPIALLC